MNTIVLDNNANETGLEVIDSDWIGVLIAEDSDVFDVIYNGEKSSMTAKEIIDISNR
jgi:hypothetical protein